MKLTGTAFIPSLQHIALSKIATLIWNQQRITPSSARLLYSQNAYNPSVRITEWEIVIVRVLKILRQLPLPEFLNYELSKHVEAVGWRIIMWFYSHKNLYHDQSSPTDMFCWTPHGTIDEKKTAEKLVQDESLPQSKRYALACLYCLEEYIYSFRDSVRRGTFNIEQLNLKDNKLLVTLWSDKLLGNFPPDVGPMTFENCGFQMAAHLRNVDAMKFFFDRLSEEEKKTDLAVSAKRILETVSENVTQVSQASATCFLLSAMDEEDLKQLLHCHLWDVLNNIAVWPRLECFIEIVEHLKSSFSETDYFTLLDVIILKVEEGCKEYNYLQLFTRYWHEISFDWKRDYVSKLIEDDKLMQLLDTRNQQLFGLVLAVASVSQKEAIIFGCENQTVCLSLIKSNKWNMLKLLLADCLRSMEDIGKIEQLRQDFKCHQQRFGGRNTPRASKPIWRKLFMLLDKVIRQHKKRIEEGHTLAKRRRQT